MANLLTYQDINNALCCPICKSELLFGNSLYSCTKDNCLKSYPFINGFPCFVSDNDTLIQCKTQSHYQDTPFQWGQDKIKDNYLKFSGAGRFLTKYLSDFPKGGNILDCGCGTGIISNFLYEKDFNVHSMDLSFTSLKLTNKTHGLNVIHASNLELPFKDNFFDVVISSGVVHHTPDAKKSVEELTRVLRPDGLLYLLIYRKPSIPFLEYSTIGALVRKLIKYKYGKKLVDHILVPIAIPIIYVGKSMIFKTLKHSKFQEYKNYFYDRYATPQATFHRKKEVESWFASSRVTVVDYYKGNFGYHHNFVCRKEH